MDEDWEVFEVLGFSRRYYWGFVVGLRRGIEIGLLFVWG